MNEVIDMNNKLIIGVKDGVNSKHAVNVQQLRRLMNEKQNISYYEQLFEYWFDLLDPNMFTVNPTASGAIVKKINDKLNILSDNVGLNDFSSKHGLPMKGREGGHLLSMHLSMSNPIGISDDMTLIITFEHYHFRMVIKLGSDSEHKSARINVYSDKFELSSGNEKYSESISSSYQNKRLMLWFTKKGNLWKLNLCANGGLITKTVNWNVNIKEILFYGSTYIQRIGISRKFYDVDGPEFHKILFLEKSRGTFFT